MASTSFSLAGKQHPSVAENFINSTKNTQQQPELVVEPEPVLAVEQAAEPVLAVEQAAEPVLAVEQAAEPVLAVEPEPVLAVDPEPALAAWNVNWSRAKLFEAASSLNLKVSAISSKNEIIAALKAATA